MTFLKWTMSSMHIAILLLGLCISFSLVAGGRLRPPADFACEPNHMTSWTGLLVFYWREASQLGFTIDTDDGTQESLITAYSLDNFLINGEHFTYGDWSKVESEVGLLKPMTRARVWLCDNDGNATLIDWQVGIFL
ncbi:hypothetical protein [Shewanella violacea]|uniref:Uncharacterized protein n=2 Tax=Shewanella violacea TaxID=60217 RepID=D4ZL55_SHEVD|nr:hypothetical protein SVI_2433 [Shewanella violacea DSS12]